MTKKKEGGYIAIRGVVWDQLLLVLPVTQLETSNDQCLLMPVTAGTNSRSLKGRLFFLLNKA